MSVPRDRSELLASQRTRRAPFPARSSQSGCEAIRWLAQPVPLSPASRTLVDVRVTALAGYLRHAERFGTDGVLDTARGDLDPEQLETLARELAAGEGATPHPPAPAAHRGTGQGSNPTARLTVTRCAREGCEEQLDAERATRRYCSDGCRQAAYRARRAS